MDEKGSVRLTGGVFSGIEERQKRWLCGSGETKRGRMSRTKNKNPAPISSVSRKRGGNQGGKVGGKAAIVGVGGP